MTRVVLRLQQKNGTIVFCQTENNMQGYKVQLASITMELWDFLSDQRKMFFYRRLAEKKTKKQ